MVRGYISGAQLAFIRTCWSRGAEDTVTFRPSWGGLPDSRDLCTWRRGGSQNSKVLASTEVWSPASIVCVASGAVAGLGVPGARLDDHHLSRALHLRRFRRTGWTVFLGEDGVTVQSPHVPTCTGQQRGALISSAASGMGRM